MKRHIQVTLDFEIDDAGTHISEEEFAEGIAEILRDDTVMSDQYGEDVFSDVSDYFGFAVFNVWGVDPVEYEHTEGDDDEEYDDDET